MNVVSRTCEDFLDWFFNTIFPVLLVILIGILFLGLIGLIFCMKEEDHCIQKHKGMVTHPAFTSMVVAGKVIVPMYHPAHESYDWICDQYDNK